jgi:GNAT superfamily N-acetyltransferase
MAMFEIVEATADHQIGEVRALFDEYHRQLGVDLCFQDFERELAGLPGDYTPPAGRLLLALVDDAPAGCIALRPLPANACEMKRLYVRPAYQGSGLGRALVEKVIALARGAGYGEMFLDTLPSMEAAQRLYARLGFRDTDPYRVNPVAGSRFMALRLGGRA